MAYIVDSPFGELRGKLAGSVFSRNGHGQYVRGYVLPTNPNTLAQATARNAFSDVVVGYKNLSPGQRTAWGDYAKTLYRPRKGSHSMKYSGYQAYVALNMANIRSVYLNAVFDVKFNGASPSIPLTFYDWDIGVPEPPTSSKLNNAKESNGIVRPFVFDEGSIKSNGITYFRVYVPNTIGTTKYSQWMDANNNRTGFVVYISNPMDANNYYVKNPLYICMGHFKAWSSHDPGVYFYPFNYLSYHVTVPLDLTKYKAFPTAGKWVQMTLFSIGLSGQMIKVGDKIVQVEAP